MLRAEIPKQGEALRRAVPLHRASIGKLVELAAGRGITEWVVTGCGDSLFAGQCGEVWFARRAGMRLRAIHAMELSRYLYPTIGATTAVLAVSHSGTTARVIEAAAVARKAGAVVVALTANESSELAQIAELTIGNSVYEERSNTRTASFQVVALFMRMLADRLADDLPTGRYEQLADSLKDYVSDAEKQVAALPDEMFAAEHWTMAGAGFGLAMSEYGKAKLYEAATLPAHAAELEQFIHCEIFTITDTSVIALICPHGPATSRARELAAGLSKLGAMTVAVTDDPELARLCRFAIRLPAGMPETDLPFYAAIPLQWLALRLARVRGEDPDLVANKWVNRPLIDESTRWLPGDAA
jgi:glutamine---fructose-6-phosphate transaminase (isomerizing)